MKRTTDGVLGVWSMATALLANANGPMTGQRPIIIKCVMADSLRDLERSEQPKPTSWRHLADAMNWTKALVELGLATDEGGVLDRACEALQELADNSKKTGGKLRMGAAGTNALRSMVEQFGELLDQVSEQAYWSALRRAEKRVGQVARGQLKPGDILVKV